MSSTEDRPTGAGGPFDDSPADTTDAHPAPPEPADDAPTQVGLPVAPAPPPAASAPPPGYGGYNPPAPAPADAEGPSLALIALLAGLLIAALALGGLLAFNLLGPPAPASPVPPTLFAGATPAATQPGPTPPPAGATDTPPADSPPAASPSPPVGTPSAEPADPQQRLLGHIPPHLRSSCQPSPGTAPALASASCQADDGQILATYFLYGDESAMNAAYDGFVASSGVERDSGRCSEPETWPSEGSYSISQQPAGRVLCMQISDAPTVYWTDGRLLILTWAFHFQSDAERLYEFWETEAGPSF